jgi:N4-gp56 family major capsid protein
MAATQVATANKVTQFRKKFFKEYVRESLFGAYYGTDENAIIQLVEDLGTEAGKTVSCPLITRLTNAGPTGDDTLEGNEEALGNYAHEINIDQVRNGVRVGKMEQKATVIDLLEAGRTMLKMWIMDDLRDAIIQALASPNVDGVTDYASCTEAEKDAWLAANNDRVLFGAALSNNAANDHSAALLQVDSTTDVLDLDMVQLGKRLAKKADRKIRPHRIDSGAREWFVLFCETYAYRDLKADTETVHQNADERGSKNKIFTDADLILDGTTAREVPEIPVRTGVGAGGIDVSGNFLCGAQSVGLAWGQRSRFATDSGDYGNWRGVAVGEIRGVEKLMFNSIQNGVVTIYASAVADS